jgi:hypothetical protein
MGDFETEGGEQVGELLHFFAQPSDEIQAGGAASVSSICATRFSVSPWSFLIMAAHASPKN